MRLADAQHHEVVGVHNFLLAPQAERRTPPTSLLWMMSGDMNLHHDRVADLVR
jgi:hypothetical protein